MENIKNKKGIAITLLVIMFITLLFCSFSIIGCSTDSNDCYNITVSGDSNVTVYGTGKYSENENVYIYAVAKDGYEFLMWDDGVTENPRKVMVTSDKNYSAVSKIASEEQVLYCLDYIQIHNATSSVGDVKFQVAVAYITNGNSSETDNKILKTSEGSFITGEWICKITDQPVLYGRYIKSNSFSFTSQEKLGITVALKYSDNADTTFFNGVKTINPSDVASSLNSDKFMISTSLS